MEKDVRDWCKALRKGRALTQDQLADETTISQGLISRLETDASYFPTVDVLERFARAFGMALSDFFGQIENKSYAVTEKATAERVKKSPSIPEAIAHAAPVRATDADLVSVIKRFEQATAILDAERKRAAKQLRQASARPRSQKSLRRNPRD
jgi:transcriptional regulator with XRE-family HTH domain